MAKEFNPDLEGHDGTGRVKLHFRALEKDGEVSAEKIVTVPSGVSAFDAASWNGIAIDSINNHGTTGCSVVTSWSIKIRCGIYQFHGIRRVQTKR